MSRLASTALLAFFAAVVAIGHPRADEWDDCAHTAAFDRAIAACTQIIEAADLVAAAEAKGMTVPDLLANIHFNRGAAYSRRHDNDRAIADYDRALAFDPDLAIAYNGRGVVHASNGRLADALADYDRAIELDPNFIDPLNNRADALRNLGEFDRAIADLDRAIAIDPQFSWAYLTRGEVHLDRDELRQARADLLSAIEFDTAGENLDYAQALLAEIQRRRNTPSGPVPATGAETRVALVIGNGAYRATGQLANPPNDADTIAAALEETGFTSITVVHDLDRDGMVAALQAFGAEADASDWAVVYFAGHGLEIGGINYLVPVDAQLSNDRDVPDEAISLDRVLAAVEGARKLRVVVLDACRNNPFLAQMRAVSATRSVGRGLVRVEPSAATLVAYSAKDGTIALDGPAGNSPFAAALAERITEPGVEINKVFRFVRSDVLAATDSVQEPFVYGSLPPEDFYFIPPS